MGLNLKVSISIKEDRNLFCEGEFDFEICPNEDLSTNENLWLNFYSENSGDSNFLKIISCQNLLLDFRKIQKFKNSSYKDCFSKLQLIKVINEKEEEEYFIKEQKTFCSVTDEKKNVHLSLKEQSDKNKFSLNPDFFKDRFSHSNYKLRILTEREKEEKEEERYKAKKEEEKRRKKREKNNILSDTTNMVIG